MKSSVTLRLSTSTQFPLFRRN